MTGALLVSGENVSEFGVDELIVQRKEDSSGDAEGYLDMLPFEEFYDGPSAFHLSQPPSIRSVPKDARKFKASYGRSIRRTTSTPSKLRSTMLPESADRVMLDANDRKRYKNLLIICWQKHDDASGHADFASYNWVEPRKIC